MIEEIKIDRLEELIQEMMKKIRDTYPTESREGNPIEIDNAAAAPLVKCITSITGSQDLHGYGKPWAGGNGKNKYNYETRVDDYYIRNDGEIRSAVGSCYSALIPVSGTVTFSGHSADGGVKRIVEYDSNGDFLRLGNSIEATSNTDYSITATVGENTVSIRISLLMTDTNVQVESGSTASSYEPYANICPITAYTSGSVKVEDEDEHSTTYATTFSPSIYSGVEDLVNGSVTYYMSLLDLGSLTWSYNSTNHFFQAEIPNVASVTYTEISKAISSHYATGSVASVRDGNTTGIAVNGTGYVYVHDDRYTDGATFKAAMDGVQFCYELATPSTALVTVSNVPISSVHGYNKIESSTGDMEVTYITEEFEALANVPAES